jgi:CBS domain-containing protein
VIESGAGIDPMRTVAPSSDILITKDLGHHIPKKQGARHANAVRRCSGDNQMKSVLDIMTTSVRTIHHNTFVGDVEGIFVTRKISAAPVVDDSGDMVGFVSKSDITRFCSTGEDPAYARVREIAHPKVISIESSADIGEAADKMLDEHVHHLVVIDEEDVVGVVSSLDFVELVARNRIKF